MAENGPFLKSKKRVRKHFCEKFLIFNSVLTFMTKILVVRFFGKKETSEMTETTFGKVFLGQPTSISINILKGTPNWENVFNTKKCSQFAH